MRRWRGLVVLLAGAAAALACLLGLIGQAGRFAVQPDAINIVAPAWIGGGLAAAAILLFLAPTRAARYLALGAIVILGALSFSLFWVDPRSSGPSECPGEALRLVQFNVLKDNRDVGAAAAWIIGAQPDIVTLEEATVELPIVALLRPQYPYAVACAPMMRCSTVILSRRPFLAAGGLARGDPENRKALSAAWATIPSPVGPFTLVAAHFDRPWPWHNNPGDPLQLTRFIRGQDPATALLAGDFNLPSGTFQLRHLTQRLGLTRAPDIRSWPATTSLPPLVAIDHVFYGSRFTIDRIVRGPLLGSDHYPLLVDLRLLPPTCGPPTQ